MVRMKQLGGRFFDDSNKGCVLSFGESVFKIPKKMVGRFFAGFCEGENVSRIAQKVF